MLQQQDFHPILDPPRTAELIRLLGQIDKFKGGRRKLREIKHKLYQQRFSQHAAAVSNRSADANLCNHACEARILAQGVINRVDVQVDQASRPRIDGALQVHECLVHLTDGRQSRG